MEENNNSEAIENFDVMKWLRGVRDANYERLGHLPTPEYVHQLSEEGRQSPLWKKMTEKTAEQKSEPFDKLRTGSTEL